jgi:hypothetical protein
VRGLPAGAGAVGWPVSGRGWVVCPGDGRAHLVIDPGGQVPPAAAVCGYVLPDRVFPAVAGIPECPLCVVVALVAARHAPPAPDALMVWARRQGGGGSLHLLVAAGRRALCTAEVVATAGEVSEGPDELCVKCLSALLPFSGEQHAD